MDDRQVTESVGAVADWLVDGARTARQPQDVLAELCARLVACGLPLHRVASFVRTLHPDVMGRRFLWRAGEGVTVSEAKALDDAAEMLESRDSAAADEKAAPRDMAE